MWPSSVSRSLPVISHPFLLWHGLCSVNIRVFPLSVFSLVRKWTHADCEWSHEFVISARYRDWPTISAGALGWVRETFTKTNTFNYFVTFTCVPICIGSFTLLFGSFIFQMKGNSAHRPVPRQRDEAITSSALSFSDRWILFMNHTCPKGTEKIALGAKPDRI